MPCNVHPFSLSFQNQHTHHIVNTQTRKFKTEKTNMPINRIYPHYPKPNPTPPLKRRNQNSPFATTASPKKDDTILGPPTKKLAVIETEPILANDFYETAGPRNINPSPKPRTNENA
jgi:hypothetical protein